MNLKPKCASCGADALEGKTVCFSCQMNALTDQYLVSHAENDQEIPVQKSRSRLPFYVAVIVVSLAATAYQVPDLLRAFKPPKPYRMGTYDTDKMTDGCVNQLWKISKLLQEKKSVDASLICPQSGSTYSVSGSTSDAVVQCPNPEMHQASKIWVSRSVIVPRIE